MLGYVAKASSKWFWVDRRYFSIYLSFKKNYNEESNEGYFLDVDVQYPEILREIPNDLPFLPERIKLERSKSLLIICMIKGNCYSHKKFKAIIKSGIHFEKNSYSDKI